MEIRLQKYLSECGIASRRHAEKLIENGEILVNKKIVTELGTKINPETDEVIFQNKIIKREDAFIYYALNKPVGYTTTSVHDQDDLIVTDLIPKTPRVFPVGRLDKSSSGLIILTNDGDLTNKLTHPSFTHDKEYIVEIKPNQKSHFTTSFIKKSISKLQNGIMLDGKLTSSAKIENLEINSKQELVKFIITIHEGRNRQIRRMVERVGFYVVGLHRIRVAKLHLGDIKLGEFKIINKEDII